MQANFFVLCASAGLVARISAALETREIGPWLYSYFDYYAVAAKECTTSHCSSGDVEAKLRT
jgi:hypothetical protein